MDTLLIDVIDRILQSSTCGVYAVFYCTLCVCVCCFYSVYFSLSLGVTICLANKRFVLAEVIACASVLYYTVLQFGFEASSSELRLRLDRVEAELNVEKKKCLMLRREVLMDRADKVAGDVCDKRSMHVQMAELRVMFR